MKFLVSIFFCWLLAGTSLFAQARCTLLIKKDQLSGTCTNSYFDGFQIDLDRELDQIDSAVLFSLLPLKGRTVVNQSAQLEVDYVITTRVGFPQLMAKSTPGWFTFDSLQFDHNALSFYIDLDPDVPFARSDLDIIQKTKALLSTPDQWHKNDDRNCEDDIENGSYSLFCALQASSIEVEGGYNHRNAVMQLVRHQINEYYPGRKWAHRLRDFNNIPETTYETIRAFLEQAEQTITKALKKD